MNQKEFFGASIPELQKAVDDWRRAGEFHVLYSIGSPPKWADAQKRFELTVYYHLAPARGPGLGSTGGPSHHHPSRTGRFANVAK